MVSFQFISILTIILIFIGQHIASGDAKGSGLAKSRHFSKPLTLNLFSRIKSSSPGNFSAHEFSQKSQLLDIHGSNTIRQYKDLSMHNLYANIPLFSASNMSTIRILARLCTEISVLWINLHRNQYRNDFILSIIYAVCPRLYFCLNLTRVRSLYCTNTTLRLYGMFWYRIPPDRIDFEFLSGADDFSFLVFCQQLLDQYWEHRFLSHYWCYFLPKRPSAVPKEFYLPYYGCFQIIDQHRWNIYMKTNPFGPKIKSLWSQPKYTPRFYLNPPSGNFGPEFSSDNAGDGPSNGSGLTGSNKRLRFPPKSPSKIHIAKPVKSTSSEDPVKLLTWPKLDEPNFKAIPVYAPEDFSKWTFEFKISLPHDLDEILDGREERIPDPEVDDDGEVIEPYTGNQAYNWAESLRRSKMLYRCIHYAVSNSTSHFKAAAQAAIRKHANPHHAKEAWDEIVLLHDEATAQNKLMSVQALLTLRQKPSESVQDYKIRTETAFERLMTLQVTFSELKAVQFLCGLHERYQPLVDQICLRDSGQTDLESVFREIQSYDQRKQLRELKPASANQATTEEKQVSDEAPSHIKNLTRTTKALQKQLKAMQAQLNKKGNASSAGSSSDQRSYTRDGLDHTIRNHPDSPTPWEKTQKCSSCSSKGHMRRTCKKRSKTDSDKPPQGEPPAKKKTTPHKANVAITETPRSTTKVATALAAVTVRTFGPGFSSDNAGDGPPKPAPVVKRARITPTPTELTFIVDSGCSKHMSGELRPAMLENLRSTDHSVSTATGALSPAVAEGDFGVLKDVLSVPTLTHNLLSVRQSCEQGHIVVFDSHTVRIYPKDTLSLHDTQPLFTGNVNSAGVYELVFSREHSVEHALTSNVTPQNKYTLWHQRLGHPNSRTMKNMVTQGKDGKLPAHGITFTNSEMKLHKCSGICRGCALGQMTRRPQNSKSKTPPPNEPAPGRLIFADVLFSPIESLQGHKTCAPLLCYADTRYLWIYAMRSKGEVPEKIREWLLWMKAHGKPIEGVTTFRSDNGGEFVSRELDGILSEAGIKKEMSAPYAHVGVAERQIRSAQTMARTILLAAGIKPGFWVEALHTAVHTLNRLTNNTNTKITRYERFHGTKPDLSHLRTFGCQAYVASPPPDNPTAEKWTPHSLECRFVGYDPAHPTSWRFWCPATHQFLVSDSAVFDENIYSNVPSRDESGGSAEVPSADREATITFIQDNLLVDEDPSTSPESVSTAPPPTVALPAPATAAGGAEPPPRPPIPQEPTRVSMRQPKPNRNFDSNTWCTNSAQALFGETMPDPAGQKANIPNTYKQATSESNPHHAEWRKAIEKEVQSLHQNETFTIMPRPEKCRVLGLKWVFRVKENQDGSIDRYKARCTALGNLQRSGIDYGETFSPVVRYSTVRTLLAVAAQQDLLVHQMDVDTAFLYGIMSEEKDVYVEVPPGYPIPPELQGHTNLVAKVEKSIYGLKQAPRLWNKHIDDTLTSRGFTKSMFDPCLYSRKSQHGVVYVTIYVDDLIIAATNTILIDAFKDELKDVYSMKDLGPLTYCLGMEVSRDSHTHTITVKQTKYIHDVLRRFGMLDCHPIKTPLDPGTKLSKTMAPQDDAERAAAAKFPYREIVGSLMYLMVSSRPDIAYAVGQLAMYMNCHGPGHHAAALHILRYIKGTAEIGLTYGLDHGALALSGYSDADWGANLDTRRSITGYVFYLAGGPISWKSKLQPTVALSTTEAEYMALTAAAQEAMSLRGLLSEFDIEASSPTLIYEDNKGAVAMSINPVLHQATKHISIRHHFIREKVVNNDVRLEYISTSRMLADALTKPLAYTLLERLRAALMGSLSHASIQ